MKISPAEEAVLQRRAAEHGVTAVRYLVESALSDDRGETPTERRELVARLFELQRLLSNVANNVNQIARLANTTGEVGELRAVFDETRVVYERIDEALDYIASRGGAGGSERA